MKKTNEELLEFFGLKVGDKVKIEGCCYPIVIKTGIGGFIYADEILTSCTCNIWFLPDLVSLLLQSNYEIITPKKKVGELICDEEIICASCPLRAIDCDSIEWLEKYKNVDEPEEKELTPEEVEKEMEKLKAKFEPKTPEALKERA